MEKVKSKRKTPAAPKRRVKAKDVSATLQTLGKELFAKIGIEPTEMKVEPAQEGLTVQVVVDPNDSGMLIGYHGETIAALQLMLGLLLHQKTGEWQRVSLNINDYRDKRDASLKEMALHAAERAVATQEEVVMPPMGGYDRRVVHMTLSDNPGVRTESVGEGNDRRLVIYPKGEAQKQT